MKLSKIVLFSFILIMLILSVTFSIKSFTGYLVSDISDGNANFNAFLFLLIGLFGTWLYIAKFKAK